MHVLYIHRNFPAQFGHLARAFIARREMRATFASEKEIPNDSGIHGVQYQVRGSANQKTHFASVPFENFVWHSDAAFQALKRHPEIRPDLIVSHSGFGTTLFLRELYGDIPIIHFCEWFYRSHGGDTDFREPRQDERVDEVGQRLSGRNAGLLSDLANCTLGYSPTEWQRSRFPHEYQHKLLTIFDGIDTSLWKPNPSSSQRSRIISGKSIPDDCRIVTYVSRGFESIRGFDVFMKIAEAILRRRKDVVLLCIGSDRICYGNDLAYIPEKSFREHMLRRVRIPSDRMIFTGQVPPQELARILGVSDLHIYLTAPFVLSWSLFNAMACGCTILASDTAPLREVIQDGKNGFIAPYWDVDAFADTACYLLKDAKDFRNSLGVEATATIHSKYSLEVVLPQMEQMYERAIAKDVPVSSWKADAENKRLPEKVSTRLIRRLINRTPMETLRCQSSWGSRPPDSDILPLQSPAFSSQSRSICHIVQQSDCSCILQLGAWRGDMTLELLNVSPKATVIAVDEWVGGAVHYPDHPSWKTSVAHVWESFAAKCWKHRHRIIPLRQRLDIAIRDVHRIGAVPEIIVVHPEYDTRHVEQLLSALNECFQEATWVGTHWSWNCLRRQLTGAARSLNRSLCVQGSTWCLRPARLTTTDFIPRETIHEKSTDHGSPLLAT